MSKEGLEPREQAAVRKLIFQAASPEGKTGASEEMDIIDAVEEICARFDRHDEEISDVQERMDQLERGWSQWVVDMPTQKLSKREKMYAVAVHAIENERRGQSGVMVSKDAAAGAAGCSPRHALNLFDDMGEQFEWAEKDLNGDQARLRIKIGDRDQEAFLEVLAADFPEVVDE